MTILEIAELWKKKEERGLVSEERRANDIDSSGIPDCGHPRQKTADYHTDFLLVYKLTCLGGGEKNWKQVKIIIF